MKKLLTLFTLLFSSSFLFAQDATVEMAETFRSSGKIYVVVAVMTILFIAFIVYLFSIDKRVKKLEK